MTTQRKVPAGMEVCYACGGYGGEDAANFGDCGWHPCFTCGESGYVPAGAAAHHRRLEAEARHADFSRPAYNNRDQYD